MFDLSPVRKLLRGSGKRRTTRPPVRSRPRPAGARLSLESLEDRNLLSASFAPPVSFPTGAGPASVLVADFNADGVPDLLTANSLDASVSVLLGNGDGSFQPARNTAIDGFFMSEFRALEVAVGDFNGDGIQDLAVATLDPDTLGGDLSILLGNGDGTFGAQTRVLTTAEFLFVPTPVVGDLNGDGRLDIVTTTFGDSTLGVLLGNGDGTFEFRSFRIQNPPFARAGNPLGAQLGDVNNDGHLDLVGVTEQHFVTILLGNGDGTFQDAQNLVTGQLPTSVALADLNQDGTLDIVSSHRTNSFSGDPRLSGVSVLLGNGDGSFQDPLRFATSTEASGNQSTEQVVVGDFNGDGIPDLAARVTVSNVGLPARRFVSVLLGNGDGTFQGPERTSIDQIASNSTGVVAADLNGDGLTDVVTTHFNLNTVSVLLREPEVAPISDPGSVSLLVDNGDGAFRDAQHFGTSLNSGALAVGGAPAPAIDAATVDSLLASHPGEAADLLLAAGRRTAPAEAFADWLNPL